MAAALLASAFVLAALVPASALGAAEGTDRPLHGTISGTASGTVSGPGTFAFSGEGSGNLAYLGKATMTIEGTVVLVASGEATLHGTVVFVSANGDQLTGTFSGFVSVVTGSINLGGPITGGTGRFEDASGFFDVRGSTNVVTDFQGFTATFEFPFTGVISY